MVFNSIYSIHTSLFSDNPPELKRLRLVQWFSMLGAHLNPLGFCFFFLKPRPIPRNLDFIGLRWSLNWLLFGHLCSPGDSNEHVRLRPTGTEESTKRVLKVWPLEQQHQRHPGTFLRQILSPDLTLTEPETLELGPSSLCLNQTSGGPEIHLSVRSTRCRRLQAREPGVRTWF